MQLTRRLTTIARDFLPPVIERLLRVLADRVMRMGCVYVGVKWPGESADGWSNHTIVEPRRRLFAQWREALSRPHSFFPEWPPSNRRLIHTDEHNRYMCAAYVLALSARGADSATVLDWGGACADYLLLGERMLPGVKFDWHCVELKDICRLGRELNPRASFHEDGDWAVRRYNLSFSSSALQYVEDWRNALGKIAEATDQWLFVTRIPVVWSNPAYVFVQRYPLYRTSYPGWAFNYREFVDFVQSQGFELFHVFQLGAWLRIRRAPEQPVTLGLLFRRTSRSAVR